MAPAPSASAASGTRTRKTTKRSTTAKRTTATTAAKRTTKTATPSAPRTRVDVVGDYAERAVLIPVGAALIARDRVVSSVNDVVTTYTTPSKAQGQLKKFERRGTSARKGLEREVRKTRTRVERRLRQRRRGLEQTVTRLERRRGTAAKSLSEQVEQASTQLESVLQTRLKVKAPTEIASKLQERVLSRV
jgi:hypothetical protein